MADLPVYRIQPEHSLTVAFGDLRCPLEILAKALGDFTKKPQLKGCRFGTGVERESKLRAGSARESLQGHWHRLNSP